MLEALAPVGPVRLAGLDREDLAVDHPARGRVVDRDGVLRKLIWKLSILNKMIYISFDLSQRSPSYATTVRNGPPVCPPCPVFQRVTLILDNF